MSAGTNEMSSERFGGPLGRADDTALMSYLRQQVPILANACDSLISPPMPSIGALTLDIAPEPDSSQFDFIYRYRKSPTQAYCVKTDVTELVAPFQSDIPEYLFDAFFLADRSGRVFYQTSRWNTS